MIDIDTPDVVEKRKLATRNNIYRLEEAMKNMDHMTKKDIPLKHYFPDGLYVREITIPADITLTTEIHASEHIAIISKGKATVISEDGEITVEAPYTVVTKIGTKRAIYTHTEVVWTTVHVNKDNEKDIDKLIDRLTFKDEQAYLEYKS